MRRVFLALSLFAAMLSTGYVQAFDRSITLASTTSTEQSGLFEYMLPIFKAQTGIGVHVVERIRNLQHADGGATNRLRLRL